MRTDPAGPIWVCPLSAVPCSTHAYGVDVSVTIGLAGHVRALTFAVRRVYGDPQFDAYPYVLQLLQVLQLPLPFCDVYAYGRLLTPFSLLKDGWHYSIVTLRCPRCPACAVPCQRSGPHLFCRHGTLAHIWYYELPCLDRSNQMPRCRTFSDDPTPHQAAGFIASISNFDYGVILVDLQK